MDRSGETVQKNKRMNKKVFVIPIIVSFIGFVLCVIGAQMSKEVNTVAAAGFIVLSIGTMTALHVSVKEKYRLGKKIRFPLTIFFPAYPVVEDYDPLTRNMSSFKEAYSEFMAHENPQKNSLLQEYATQFLWHCLYLQRSRMEKLGIQIHLESNRRSYSKGSKSVRSNTYFDGRYNVNDVYEEIYAMRTFCHAGRKMKVVHNKEVAHYVYLSAKTVGQEDVVCPNCGSISTRSNLIDGCDYCKTKFTVEDLEHRVGSFGFRRDFQVSEKKRKAVKKLIYPWVYMMGMIPMMYIGFFFPFLYFEDLNFIMGFFLGIVGALFMAIGGFAVVTFAMLIILPTVLIFNQFWDFLDDKLIYRPPVELDKEIKMAEKVRGADPLFSLQSFFGNVQNKLYAIHFADTKKQINAFSDCDLSKYLENYQEVVDVDTLSLSMLSYENEKGVQIATVSAHLLLREFKDGKIKKRKELVLLRLEKNEDCKTQAICAPAILSCEGCGGSLSFMDGKTCKFCGREWNMKEHDWVITEYSGGKSEIAYAKAFR